MRSLTGYKTFSTSTHPATTRQRQHSRQNCSTSRPPSTTRCKALQQDIRRQQHSRRSANGKRLTFCLTGLRKIGNHILQEQDSTSARQPRPSTTTTTTTRPSATNDRTTMARLTAIPQGQRPSRPTENGRQLTFSFDRAPQDRPPPPPAPPTTTIPTTNPDHHHLRQRHNLQQPTTISATARLTATSTSRTPPQRPSSPSRCNIRLSGSRRPANGR